MINKKNEAKIKFLCKILLTLIFIIFSYNILIFDYFHLESYTKIAVGDAVPVPKGVWQLLGGNVSWQKEIAVGSDTNRSEKAVDLNVSGQNKQSVSGNGVSLPQEGVYQVTYNLWNKIPLKTIEVEVAEPVRVTVGGHSVGVLLQTCGVTVVGQAPIVKEDGGIIYPAKDAGLQIGDFITTINGTAIIDDYQVANLINELGQKGKEIILTLQRDGQVLQLPIKAYFCKDTQTYRIGVYIRDNTAGVGTLTFYESTSGKYGALGHMISELQASEASAEPKGSLVKATIQGLKIGKKGEPGEKIGVFVAGGWEGSIEKNCQLGVFGTANILFTNSYYPETIPVAFASQIQEGPAEIITVLQGEKLERFAIEIINVMPNEKKSGKGLVIKITDPELLARTGGIIQGMSGSPIIQNGMLIGAVTHVFVNDPTKGYGCLADWMMEEAGL